MGCRAFFVTTLKMARKKNIKDLDAIEMEFIDEKMKASNNSVLAYMPQYGFSALDYKISIKCKTEAQKKFMNDMKNEKNEICFGVGAPGTGKSFLSLAYALKELHNGNFRTITMIIPTAPAGGADLNLGFLKGTLEEKVTPFQECDKVTIEKILRLSGNENAREIASSLISKGYIRYEFVNFLLGKTIDDSIILVNEAQQYTEQNMRLILTRIGENSKFVITGDLEQVNRRSIVNKNDTSGLQHAINSLGNMEEISIAEFTDEDIVRNKLITKILNNW